MAQTKVEKFKIPLGKYRNWVFTYNNYTPEIVSSIMEKLSVEAEYWVFAYETGSLNNTPHLQGYIEFATQRTWNGVRDKVFSGVVSWLDVRHGTQEDALSYCKKGEQSHEQWEKLGIDGPDYGKNAKFEESSKKMKKQGKRNDIIKARLLINEGKGMAQIVESIDSYQAVRMSELILKYSEQPRKWETMIYWYWGNTGCGKTRKAYDTAQELLRTEFKDFSDEPYWTSGNLKWWEGYDGHPVVIIDEFRDTHATLDQMLRLTDRYPYRVENKGGSRQLRAKYIFITSCYPPEELFKDASRMHRKQRDSVAQLLRRIVNIQNLSTDPKWKGMAGAIQRDVEVTPDLLLSDSDDELSEFRRLEITGDDISLLSDSDDSDEVTPDELEYGTKEYVTYQRNKAREKTLKSIEAKKSSAENSRLQNSGKPAKIKMTKEEYKTRKAELIAQLDKLTKKSS